MVAANCAPQSGILTVGRYPDGVDDVIKQIGHDLGESRFDAPVVDDVMRWKYGKLLNNLGNAFDAVGDLSADEPLAERLVATAREEGMQGPEHRRHPLRRRGRAPRGPGRAHGLRRGPRRAARRRLRWQSLARGTGSIETDYLSGEISLIGRMHGVPTPVNALMQRLSARFAAEGRAPGSLPIAELAELVEQALESAG